MRILQVARYGSVKGGAERYVAALCEGLRAAGHEVALAYGRDPDPTRAEVEHGYEVAQLSEAGPEEPRGGRDDFGRVLATYRPDVVHVHVPDAPWVAPVAASRAPTLLAVHDHRLTSPAGTRYWTAWRRQCGIRPGLWCLAYNVGAHCGSLRANLTLQPYRTWRAANAAARSVPIQVFSAFMRTLLARADLDAARIAVTPYPTPALPLAEPVSMRTDRPVIFAIGRLNKEKGFHELIRALERVPRPAHLVIAGDGHERQALERRAASAGGPHRITFTGWLRAGELAGWYGRAALVAVPSVWPEPFGIVGLEAMAACRAVVAFASGGIPEWLRDGENGRLVPVGDERALADALEELLGDEDRRARMGERGRERARTEFSLERHVEQVLALYRTAEAP